MGSLLGAFDWSYLGLKMQVCEERALALRRLILLAEILAYNKSALCRSASPEFSFVLFYT